MRISYRLSGREEGQRERRRVAERRGQKRREKTDPVSRGNPRNQRSVAVKSGKSWGGESWATMCDASGTWRKLNKRMRNSDGGDYDSSSFNVGRQGQLEEGW